MLFPWSNYEKIESGKKDAFLTMNKMCLILVSLVLFTPGCDSARNSQSEDNSFQQEFWIEDYTKNLNFPWGITWLPNDDLLVTERLGKLKIVRDGKVIGQIKGVPRVMADSPFDGLLDIEIDPNFTTNSYIYLTFTKGSATARVGVVYRAKLDGNRLVEGNEIFNTSPPAPTGGPNITRIQFLKDKSMIIAVGAGGNSGNGMVQRIDGDIGKIIRIYRDGTIPTDNSFALTNKKSNPELWATGLRSIGGFAIDDNDKLWATDMGPQGGDELNLIVPGGNHGWPIVTWGFDYSGRAMSRKQSSPDFVDPVLVWSPSISPFGLTFYNGNAFPNWYGDFFVGVLGNQTILRVRLDNGIVLHQENLLPNHNERIRTVETGPDGFIYAVTDSSNGKILRLRPGKPPNNELKNISLPFDMPKNIGLGEKLRKHGVMQDEETMRALQIGYNKKLAELIYNQNCASCHSLGANEEQKVGPHLEGLGGRRSGSLSDYSYSKAMTLNDRTSVIWDDRSITAFLTNPQAYYPGTKMIAPPLSYKDALQVSAFLTRENSKK